MNQHTPYHGPHPCRRVKEIARPESRDLRIASPNTVNGSYVHIMGGGQGWFTGLTATIADPNAADDPNFAIEIVNASTGADNIAAVGTALNNNSGNWRFDNIAISGAADTSTTPEPATTPRQRDWSKRARHLRPILIQPDSNGGNRTTITERTRSQMETPRTGRLYSVVGFTIACVLMGAVPAKAQDDCKALEQAQADAWSKLHNTPAHVYSTGKTGNLTVTTELIYAGGSMYMKLNGKWTHAGSITDVDQIAAEAKKNSKDTCTHAKDELINGEMAAVYTTHSETPKGKLDMKIWISKAKGLLLRQDIDSDGGKSVNSARYDYENVKAPL